jgi:hypothetical protein
MAPWADALYAMDTPWWNVHHQEVSRVFKGLRVRGAGSAQSKLAARAMFGSGCLNSGAGALLMARHYGARLIIMLGYDCKVGADGQRHWHGGHPGGLGNAGMLSKWPEQFAKVVPQLQPSRVINATSDTALECFECMSLEKALTLS